MPKTEAIYTDFFSETIGAMNGGGVLLVTTDSGGRPNPMTIGWGAVGVIWGRPVFIVLIRPSRHSFRLIEEAGDFTINVLPRGMEDVTSFCGMTSGRDYDKFREMGLTAAPGRKVGSPIIDEGIIHYECRVVHKNDVAPGHLSPDIASSSYTGGDYHRIYFGEILAVYAAEDARERLPEYASRPGELRGNQPGPLPPRWPGF